MWKVFTCDDKDYFFSSDYEKDILTVRLTDLIVSWVEVLDGGSIVERFKDSNCVEGDIEPRKLVDVLRDDLDPSSDQVVKSVNREGEACSLRLTCEPKDLTFRFDLVRVSPEEFHKAITLPLLLVIGELSSRQGQLKRLLREKDEVICEYQHEGARLVRPYLDAGRFDEAGFERERRRSAESRASAADVARILADVGPLYLCAAKAASSRSLHTRTGCSQALDESSPTEASDKPKPLKWEIGPQNTKRFKTGRTKVKL